jgi:hypothetical protein
LQWLVCEFKFERSTFFDPLPGHFLLTGRRALTSHAERPGRVGSPGGAEEFQAGRNELQIHRLPEIDIYQWVVKGYSKKD